MLRVLLTALGLIRLLNGYVYTEDKKALEKYWRSKAWEHSAYTIVGTVMAWQGQVLLVRLGTRSK